MLVGGFAVDDGTIWATVSTAWEWVDNYSGALTVVLAAVAVIPGVLAIRSAKRDSRDRSRPVVVAELAFHPEADRTMNLVVRNAGASVARDVSITFDPALATNDENDNDAYSFQARQVFEKQIPTLAQGQVLTIPWYAHQRAGVPEVCTVTAHYRDTHGETYSDVYELSLEPYLNMVIIEYSGSIRGRLTTLARATEQQSREVKRIATTLKEIARARSREDPTRPGDLTDLTDLAEPVIEP